MAKIWRTLSAWQRQAQGIPEDRTYICPFANCSISRDNEPEEVSAGDVGEREIVASVLRLDINGYCLLRAESNGSKMGRERADSSFSYSKVLLDWEHR